MQKFNKHIIQPGETLNSLSNLYDLEEDTLKFFHNNHCRAEDHVLIGITKQKELFLPRTAVADKNKLVKFGHGNSLIFQPENSFLKYSTMITIENDTNKNELKYETSVQWLKTEKNLHFFEIDRTSKIFINEEEVNDIADLLAYKTSKVLYPLQVSVDESGKFNQVENLSIFKKRWSAVKEDIDKVFEGETVEEYCLKIENIIEEPEIVNLFVKNDYFIRTLFFGIYQSYGKDCQIKGNETFPIVDNAIEPNYEIHLEIDPLKDDYNLINIEGNGILNDERTPQDFINGAPFSLIIEKNPVMNKEGNFRIQYYLNGKTALPESLYLECDLMMSARKKISVVIANVEDDKYLI